ncbi:MAG: hypothetical protein ACLFPW_08960 [Spirochaetaceae bacterium]
MRQSAIPRWAGFLLLTAMTATLFGLTFVAALVAAPAASSELSPLGPPPEA